MKKIEFQLKKFELVKGCPTDINMNGIEDDDYNNDGNVDQYDQDYYNGYMNGYYTFGGDSEYEGQEPWGYVNPDGESDAFNAGWQDGQGEFWTEFGSENGPNGPAVEGENFKAPLEECPPY